jgi:hypothetical protein
LPYDIGGLYLPLPLRGDEENIGGHRKREMYWRTVGVRKKYSCPQYDSFVGNRGRYWGTIEDALTPSIL